MYVTKVNQVLSWEERTFLRELVSKTSLLDKAKKKSKFLRTEYSDQRNLVESGDNLLKVGNPCTNFHEHRPTTHSGKI